MGGQVSQHSALYTAHGWSFTPALVSCPVAIVTRPVKAAQGRRDLF